MSLGRWLRRLRFGPPIIVVSGLPRSGTSMMMQMLAAGGAPILSDGVRRADASNPSGYFELEAVKALDKPGDRRWLAEARGRAVKIVSALLEYLPESYNYKVIFMERPLVEVLASQDAMLARADASDAATPDAASRAALVAEYERHLRRVRTLIARRACFEALSVSYTATVADPHAAAEQVVRFVDLPLDVDAMAASVDAALYRERHSARRG
jgi:hypothetical protein